MNEGQSNPNNGTGAKGRHPLARARQVLVPVLSITAVIMGILFVERLNAAWQSSSTPVSSITSEDMSSLAPRELAELGVIGDGGLDVGEDAPEFRLLTPDGEILQLSQLQGTPTLINFWATWCVPCRREIPDLIQLQDTWGTSAQIVGVNLQEPAETVSEFAEDFGINYPLPLDLDGEVYETYRITGLPETFFLDADGVIRDHRIGQLNPEIAICIVDGIKRGGHAPEACR